MTDEDRLYVKPAKRISDMSDAELFSWAEQVVGEFTARIGPRTEQLPPSQQPSTAASGHDGASQDPDQSREAKSIGARESGGGAPSTTAAWVTAESTPIAAMERDRAVMLDDPPDYDYVPTALPDEPKAFGHIRHVEFLDREDCDMLHLDRTGVSWRALLRLTEGGYYYSGVDDVRDVTHPWAFFVNAVRDDCWSDIRMTGVSTAHARSILRTAGWRSDA